MTNCTYPKCQATNGCVGVCSKEKREWVGLTDDERSYYLQAAANVGWWQASLFIEAKLKERNS